MKHEYLNEKQYANERSATNAIRMLQAKHADKTLVVAHDDEGKARVAYEIEEVEEATPNAPIAYVLHINPYIGRAPIENAMPVIKNTGFKVKRVPYSQRSINVARTAPHIKHPTQLARSIAAQMYTQNNAVKRGDIIAECERAGIATNTARTQVQKALKELRG